MKEAKARIGRKVGGWHSCAATELLERFVDLYGEVPLAGSMIDSGMTLWRDYWRYSGQHMILSDEGWESGDTLDSYFEMLDEGESITNLIHDEINWQFGNMKHPRIFLRKTTK